ncbi:hypothetical protein F4802DRAFT_107589 [Xylaria palmicola]|nr:hypothetical protein F4802DRAFT_107589 [Xylaria palmicola]
MVAMDSCCIDDVTEANGASFYIRPLSQVVAVPFHGIFHGISAQTHTRSSWARRTHLPILEPRQMRRYDGSLFRPPMFVRPDAQGQRGRGRDHPRLLRAYATLVPRLPRTLTPPRAVARSCATAGGAQWLRDCSAPSKESAAPEPPSCLHPARYPLEGCVISQEAGFWKLSYLPNLDDGTRIRSRTFEIMRRLLVTAGLGWSLRNVTYVVTWETMGKP